MESIQNVKGLAAKREIEDMKGEDGSTVTDGASIADVFATFYEDLYQSRIAIPDETNGITLSDDFIVDPVTLDELRAALKGVQNGRARH